MTPDDVTSRVDQIREFAAIGFALGNHEAALILENDLYRDALDAIAMGDRDPVGIARAALEAQSIDFPRLGDD